MLITLQMEFQNDWELSWTLSFCGNIINASNAFSQVFYFLITVVKNNQIHYENTLTLTPWHILMGTKIRIFLRLTKPTCCTGNLLMEIAIAWGHTELQKKRRKDLFQEQSNVKKSLFSVFTLSVWPLWESIQASAKKETRYQKIK